MTQQNNIDDFELVSQVREGNQYAFSILFARYYGDVMNYCATFIPDRNECEDIVQNIFMGIWEKRNLFSIRVPFKSYLLMSARHDCFDAIKHEKIVKQHVVEVLDTPEAANWDIDHYLLHSELESKIKVLLQLYEPRAVEIFKMSRFENIKYDEIAEKLNISRRTVEVKVANVLKYLREHLVEYFVR